MTIHQTLSAARDAAKANAAIAAIIEIDHATAGRCYIGCKVGRAILQRGLDREPMPEIIRLVAEHTTQTPEEIVAQQEQARRQVTIYLSSRGWGDYSPVEWTGDITRPDAELLAECRERLAQANDVDQPNQSEADLLAKIMVARQAWIDAPTKRAAQEAAEQADRASKRASGYCYACESWCFGDCGEYSNNPATKERRDLAEAGREARYGMED